MNTHKKTALITGGAGGLGLAVVECLKNHNWNTISMDLLNAKCANSSIIPDLEIKVDVSSPEEVQEAFNVAERKFPDINALICLAGVVYDAPLVGIMNKKFNLYNIENWDKTLGVNLTGTFLCSREFASRKIRKRQKGVIITCSSPAATGAAGQSAYAASKAGVEAFTVSLARELLPWGIRVCGFRPALTRTPMAEKYPPHVLKKLTDSNLIGRFAEKHEVAASVLFMLQSDLASGRILPLDGGQYF